MIDIFIQSNFVVNKPSLGSIFAKQQIEGLEPELSMSIFGENELSPKNYSLPGCASAPKLA